MYLVVLLICIFYNALLYPSMGIRREDFFLPWTDGIPIRLPRPVCLSDDSKISIYYKEALQKFPLIVTDVCELEIDQFYAYSTSNVLRLVRKFYDDDYKVDTTLSSLMFHLSDISQRLYLSQPTYIKLRNLCKKILIKKSLKHQIFCYDMIQCKSKKIPTNY